MPKHQSKDQARNMEMVKHSCISKKRYDGKPFWHLSESKACNKLPKHQSKDLARNKATANHHCISERARLTIDGRHIRQRPRLATRRWQIDFSAQGRQGLQQMAETSLNEPGLQQADGKPFLDLKENKACNKLQTPLSRDQARNKEMVNNSCISK